MFVYSNLFSSSVSNTTQFWSTKLRRVTLHSGEHRNWMSRSYFHFCVAFCVPCRHFSFLALLSSCRTTNLASLYYNIILRSDQLHQLFLSLLVLWGLPIQLWVYVLLQFVYLGNPLIDLMVDNTSLSLTRFVGALQNLYLMLQLLQLFCVGLSQIAVKWQLFLGHSAAVRVVSQLELTVVLGRM